MNISPSMFREAVRLVAITVLDPVVDAVCIPLALLDRAFDTALDAAERWAMSQLHSGAAGTVPEGEVHITHGPDWAAN